MKFTTLFVLLTASLAAAEQNLEAVLRSPTKTLQAFKKFIQTEHLHFPQSEDSMRLSIFRSSAMMVAKANADPTQTAHFRLNKFSPMTEAEKLKWTGLNITGYKPIIEAEPVLRAVDVPSTKMWLDKVTTVRNQGKCGSCWAFAATGPLETRYAIKSGTLRKFSEQEYLDCVYDADGHDGCQGGHFFYAWDWSAKHGGRLASEAHYPYVEKDRACNLGQYPDDMIEYKIAGYTEVPASEAAVIKALSEGPLVLGMFATDLMMAYDGGIFNDHTCLPGMVNHAVTGVGYTPQYVVVKNSWGADWGDRGFIKFARGADNCELFLHAGYVKLSGPTGVEETAASDPATDYDPNDEICIDMAKGCSKALCVLNMQDYCAKTCGLCDDDTTPDGECPAGTVKCNDGVCRHQHMCH